MCPSSRHLLDAFQTPFRHHKNTNKISFPWVTWNSDFQLRRGLEVPLLIWEVATAYLFLLHNPATLWSNLQDCKISSIAVGPSVPIKRGKLFGGTVPPNNTGFRKTMDAKALSENQKSLNYICKPVNSQCLSKQWSGGIELKTSQIVQMCSLKFREMI